MATITINIPVDKEDWVLNGLALRYNYTDNVANPSFNNELPEDPITNPTTIPNPETKAQFVKARLIDHMKVEATQGHIKEQWGLKKAEEDTVVLS